eukprot:8371671-Pyramimonas_sp.AAC.1
MSSQQQQHKAVNTLFRWSLRIFFLASICWYVSDLSPRAYKTLRALQTRALQAQRLRVKRTAEIALGSNRSESYSGKSPVA